MELREIPRPEPTGDQVLVRVHAASVNRGDLDGLTPKPAFVRLLIGLRAPRNRRVGLDVAGVVEAVGPMTTRFKPGDRVFADLYLYGLGAFADYACAPEKAFERIAPDMSFEDAATLPHSAILGLQGLRRRGGRTVQPGERVLVVGASGNVGPFAVQIAKSMGAEVTGVCHRDKVDLVRSLGADHVIDYTAGDYTRSAERYDWIVDTDSHVPLFRARRMLRPNGAYVTLGGGSFSIFGAMIIGSLLSIFGGKWSGLMLWWKPFHPPDVDEIKRLLATGKVKPVIDRRYRLDEVVDALRHVDTGRARGKVVITVRD